MAHRFADLFERYYDLSAVDRTFRVIDNIVAIGPHYEANISFSSIANNHVFISIIHLTTEMIVGRIGLYLDRQEARYYYNSTGYNVKEPTGWSDRLDDAAPFFEHMKDNHQEVAEWLLWYI